MKKEYIVPIFEIERINFTNDLLKGSDMKEDAMNGIHESGDAICFGDDTGSNG